MHTNHIRKKKESSCLSYVWWERRQPLKGPLAFCTTWGTRGRAVILFLYSRGEKCGAQENMLSERARRGRDLRTPECNEKDWRVLLRSVRKALLTTNHCKEKTKGAESIHCDWKGGKKRWPSKYNLRQWWLSWQTEGQHKTEMTRTEDFWQQLRKPGETAVSLTKEGGDKMNA